MNTVILAELGVERTHGAVWNGVHRLADSVLDPPRAKPSRVAVDETAGKINGEWSWLYAAIDLDTKLILNTQLFGRHGTDPRSIADVFIELEMIEVGNDIRRQLFIKRFAGMGEQVGDRVGYSVRSGTGIVIENRSVA